VWLGILLPLLILLEGRKDAILGLKPIDLMGRKNTNFINLRFLLLKKGNSVHIKLPYIHVFVILIKKIYSTKKLLFIILLGHAIPSFLIHLSIFFNKK